MWYVIEQYRWDVDGNLRYYHLVDSKIFKSDKVIPECDYFKDGSYFSVYKIEENEVQTTRRISRTTSRKE